MMLNFMSRTRLNNAWSAYETALRANNVNYEGRVYNNAMHGFFSDATPERYDEASAS